MTDHTEETIEVRASLLAVLGNPQATVGDIEAGLGQVWEQSDANGRALVETTWERVQTLAATAQASFEAAVTSKLEAKLTEKQRDELIDAIENLDITNPYIAMAVELIEEDAYESLDTLVDEGVAEQMEHVFDTAYDDAHEVVEENLTDKLERDYDMSRPTASHFVKALLYNWPEIPADTRRAIGASIERELGAFA